MLIVEKLIERLVETAESRGNTNLAKTVLKAAIESEILSAMAHAREEEKKANRWWSILTKKK